MKKQAVKIAPLLFKDKKFEGTSPYSLFGYDGFFYLIIAYVFIWAGYFSSTGDFIYFQF